MRRLLGLLAISLLAAHIAFAQARSDLYIAGVNYKLPSVVITAGDLQATKADMIARKVNDVPVRMVDGGGHNVGVSLVYRLKGANNNPVIHDKVSEVYYVLEGSGTIVTGGTLVNPERRPESGGNGPGLVGAAIERGVSRQLKKGDIIIIPAGTPHKWSDVDEFMTYTVVRVDQGRIVPLK
jgi:mannose-6-phosphate isomerase-like protein (cupin superfamily)